MTDTTDMTIIKELLDEVKGYLPEMQSCLEILAGNGNDAQTVKELHRMTHTISGVAAMVQLTELSKSAAVMEDVLDSIMAENTTVTAQHIDVMSRATQFFKQYCEEMSSSDLEVSGLYQDVSSAFAVFEHQGQESDNIEEDPFLGGLGADDEGATDNFFQELEADSSDADDELQTLFNNLEESSGDIDAGSESNLLVNQETVQEDTAVITREPQEQVAGDAAIDQELLECFYEEVEEHLENMGDQLNQLNTLVTAPVKKNAAHREILHSLRRSVHTMKGAAAVIGIDSVAKWGHEFEDFLDTIHDDSARLTPDLVSAMFQGADLLEKIASSPEQDYSQEKTLVQSEFNELINIESQESKSVETLPVSDDVGEELEKLLAVTETTSLFEESGEDEDFASAVDDELLECFREEVEEHLENIGVQLNTLSSSVVRPGAIDEVHREQLHSLRRSVHTMKGAAAVIGIEPVAEWGHQFEDFLDWVHDDSDIIAPEIVSAMLDGADLLENIAKNPDGEFGREITATKDTFLSIIKEKGRNVASDAMNHIVEFNPADEEDEDTPQSMAIDSELLEIFSVEAEEHLENIGRKLNILSSLVTAKIPINEEHRAGLHSLRRSVHDLKGAANVVGVTGLAEWGHEFENFLDWLHDTSEVLAPEIVNALLEGADILEHLAENPDDHVPPKNEELRKRFQAIIAGTADLSTAPAVDRKIKRATALPESERNEHRKKIRKKTLRVGVDKINEVMGLSDDIAINLSSSEDSMQNMLLTLEEMGSVLQRLKGIASSLEAGYELSTIPHFGAPTQGEDAEEGIIEEFDPLEMDRYSELNVLIRSLNESVVDLDAIRDQATDVHGSWRTNIERQRKMLTELQGKMKGVQMTPFSTLANRLYRTVRESARVTGKAVRLVVEGGNIEMDSYVWDILADPLMHMLRNSVDHGIEKKQERLQQEKPEQATIRIQCFRRGNQFALRLSDDGRGLDLESIRKRAMTLYPDLGVDKMNERELAGLIFKQGFSIRTQVTQMSGRGVGMDVVGNAVELLHGTIEVTTVANKGAEFLFLLPITVAQLPALLVYFGQQQFAVPMRDITRVIRLNKEEINQNTVELSGDVLPLIRPAKLLGLRWKDRFTPGATVHDNYFGVAVKAGGKRAVLVIDEIIGNRDLVFKNLGSHLLHVPCVAGATIMGDGSLVPILHTEDIFNREQLTLQTEKISEQKIGPSEGRILTVLAVDDSISIRKVLKKFIIDQGWHPVLAVDGVDGMEKIRETTPDLVLLDVEMPRMNGFEVLQFLQSRNESRDIPVLMLTSRSAEKYRNKAEQLGARGFVTKPFVSEKLASLIIETIEKG
jgi:chemosensory pili system protein ChpA (sensor histidine kinase/response regulator)